MSKRTIEEVEEENATSLAKAFQKKQKKDKERKEKVEGAHKIAANVSDALMERLEKRVKKDKKDKKAKGKKDKTDSATKTDASAAVENSDPAKPKLSKDERKAAKRLVKEPKNQVSTQEPNVVNRDAVGSRSTLPISTSGYIQCAELTACTESEIKAYLKENAISIEDPHKSNLRPITNFSYLPANQFSFGGFKNPTPIQAATWPFTLSGFDCVGVAETGSGKTLAFSVPAIRHICEHLAKAGNDARKFGVRVVVVSPTRELAMQIFEVTEKYLKETGLFAVCVYGGVPKEEQRSKLKRAQVVVATPGRLNDLIDEGSADLSKVSYLVLDEADRMLDKGFEEDIKRILAAIPSTKRQTLMFTATWPQSVREIASKFMNSPVKITIGDRDELRANTRIKQTVEVVDQRAKEQHLLQLVKQYQSGASKDDRILVFCLYKKEASRIESFIRRKGYRVAGIHGDLSQAQRTHALGEFKSGKCPLLVATDVAARGLDIPAVKLVINVTFPLTIEDYVHRIGRTGRAGADGMAYTFFTEHDKSHSGSLVNVLKAANQEVPESLLKFGTTVRKKEHSVYGAFFKDTDDTKTSTKIIFDD